MVLIKGVQNGYDMHNWKEHMPENIFLPVERSQKDENGSELKAF